MSVSEELQYRTITAVLWFVGVLVVLTFHKWAIEGIYERLNVIESKLSITTEEVSQ